MIRRIGFRRLLPVLFTLIHIGLLIYSSAPRHDAQSNFRSHFTYQSAADQEDSVAWEPMEPRPLKPAQKLAFVANLPALVLAMPIALMFLQSNDIGSLYASLPFVPLVWYSVGRWLDRLMGYISQSHQPRRAWRRLFTVISTILLCLSIASITPVNHHRTHDAYWVGSALILWSGLFLAISISGSFQLRSNS